MYRYLLGLCDHDVMMNKTTGGLQYTGQALTNAKAVSDCGPGGMTVLSLSAFEAWKHETASTVAATKAPPHKKQPTKTDPQADEAHGATLILHSGCYEFRKALELGPCTLYMALPRGLECRLALGPTTFRNVKQVASGVLQAPVGSATVAFCNDCASGMEQGVAPRHGPGTEKHT